MIEPKKNVMDLALDEVMSKEKETIKQQKLKEKYKIKDENAIVVEKKTITEYIIKLGVGILKTIFFIINIILSAVGLFTLFYEKPRNELIMMLNEVYNYIF